MTNKNDLPLYAEEAIINQGVEQIQEILSQLKQQIPANFVYLEIKEKNYQCSTTGWKEPVCERYGFEYQGDWKQIDIPHPLMDKLGLKQKEDLPPTFYLAPHLLNKDQATTQGGITLQAVEIILVNPNKIIMKEQEVQTDLSSEGIKELEETVAEQTRQSQAKDKEISDLRNQLSLWTKTFSNESANQVQTRINSLNSQITQKNTQIANLTTHQKEWEKQKQDLEFLLRIVIRPFMSIGHYVLLKDISDDFDLSLPFSYGNFPLSLDSPNLKQPKLPDKLRNLKIVGCPNLKKLNFPTSLRNFGISGYQASLSNLEFNADISRVNLAEDWNFSGAVDISRCLADYFSLVIGRIYLEGSKKTVMKYKLVFHKSQRDKKMVFVVYSWNESIREYWREGACSLDLLINKGILTNYEERT